LALNYNCFNSCVGEQTSHMKHHPCRKLHAVEIFWQYFEN